MKSQQLLQQYAQGQRNFIKVNLQGQSLRGQNLSGINLAEADLRGTNFAQTDLSKAQLNRVKIGISPQRKITLIVLGSLIYLTLGILTFINAIIHQFILSDLPSYFQITYVIYQVGVIVFTYRLVAQKNKIFLPIFIIILGSGIISLLISPRILSFILVISSLIIFNTILTLVNLIIFTALTRLKLNSKQMLWYFILLSIYLLTCWLTVQIWSLGLAITSAIALLFVVISSIATHKKFWFNQPEFNLTIFKPTSFYQSNLDQAKFTKAEIEMGDFRKAWLEGVIWTEATIKTLIQ